jgi:hypothetical protein
MCDDFCEKTFWLKNPACLFDDLTVIPTSGMTLAEKMNTLTRLVILIFIIMLIFEYKYAVHFFLIALLLIIIFYYARKKEEKRRRQKRESKVQYERYYTQGGHSDESGEEGVGEEVELSPEGLEYLRNKANKPNPRRPYPNYIPSDMEVKAGRRQFDSYMTFTGRSQNNFVTPVEQSVPKVEIQQEVFVPIEVKAAVPEPPKRRFATKNGNQESTKSSSPTEKRVTVSSIQRRRVYATKNNDYQPNKTQIEEKTPHPRVTGSDLYFRRQKQLETMFKSKIDINRQSAINSVI